MFCRNRPHVLETNANFALQPSIQPTESCRPGGWRARAVELRLYPVPRSPQPNRVIESSEGGSEHEIRYSIPGLFMCVSIQLLFHCFRLRRDN